MKEANGGKKWKWSGNKFGVEGAKMISEALMKNTTLIRVSMIGDR